jgi:hypothetical protein
MQKTILTAIAVLASVAASAADLPSKTAASAPAALPTLAQFYVGGSIGGNVNEATVYSGGAVAGWNALPFLAVEGTYDVSRSNAKVGGKYNYGNTVAINAVPQYKVPLTDVTAYAFGGIGYRLNTVSAVADHSIYNVGVGAKYEFAKSFELDGRYARIDNVKSKFNASSPTEDRVSLGVNYKF